MTEANGKPQFNLDPRQLATVLLIEGLLQQLQTASNQLGGFLKYDPGANAVNNAIRVLADDYKRLQELWSKAVVIAPASALSVIEGKVH